MRSITQDEIDNAPEWATHYCITTHDYIIYESSQLYCDSVFMQPRYNKGGLGRSSQPIPRPEFDITGYELSDCEIERSIQSTSSEVQLDMIDGSRPAIINKEDAIALAKHFKLKPEDLV